MRNGGIIGKNNKSTLLSSTGVRGLSDLQYSKKDNTWSNGKVPREGLVYYMNALDLDCYPGSGTDVYDQSVYETSGTLTGGVTYNSLGSISPYFSFDGVDDYIDLGTITTDHPLQLHNSDGFSIGGFVQFPTSGSTRQRFFTKHATTTVAGCDDGYEVHWDYSNNYLYIRIENDSFFRGGVWPTDRWCMFFITRDSVSASNNLRYYLDGEQSGTDATWNPTTSKPPLVETDAYIAARWDVANRWTRDIGQVFVYERVLSSQEVSDIFETYRGRYNL